MTYGDDGRILLLILFVSTPIEIEDRKDSFLKFVKPIGIDIHDLASSGERSIHDICQWPVISRDLLRLQFTHRAFPLKVADATTIAALLDRLLSKFILAIFQKTYATFGRFLDRDPGQYCFQSR
jgi:hypothetical protein